MNTLRTIVTTAGDLVEDVKRLYCLTCDGLGYVSGVMPWDDDRECPDCHGFGY